MGQINCQGENWRERPLPEVTFSTFIISLASSVLVGLGEVPDPATGKTARDMPLARHNIDVLEMLRQKTGGCLNREEKELLDSLLCELRLKYVINCGCGRACGSPGESLGANPQTSKD